MRSAGRQAEANLELRVQAAAVVAEAGWKSIVPTLSNLFLVAGQQRQLDTLARALMKLDVDLLPKVYPTTSLASTERLPARMRALLAAGSRTAADAVRAALKSEDLAGEIKVEMLRAYRVVHQPSWHRDTLALAPKALVELLR